MIIVDRISQLPNGAAVPAGTAVKLRRESDGTVLDTQLTDISGWVTFRANGSPGPVYTEVTVGGETRYRYGRAVAQVGSWYEGEWSSFMAMVQPGVITSMNPDALLVVPGTGLQVRVSPGSAMAEGILGQYYNYENLAIASNGSGNPRYDMIVMQLHVAGSQHGRVVITVVQGSPAATPVEPAITPLADVAQLVLARVRVQSGASSILSGDITDRRQKASFTPPGSVTGLEIAEGAISSYHVQDGSIMAVDLADGSVTGPKIAAGAVAQNKIADGAVNNAKIEDGTIAGAKLAYRTIENDDLKDDSVDSRVLAPGAVATADIADASVTLAKMAPNSVDSSKIVNGTIQNNDIADGSIGEAKLASSVVAKLNLSAGAPTILVERSTTKTNYASTSTILSRSVTLGAGSYSWFVVGTLRCTGETSGDTVNGWLQIMRNGSEVNGEPFYTTADAYGIPVDVMGGGSFTRTESGSETFALRWSKTTGVLTANSRQILLWIQKVS